MPIQMVRNLLVADAGVAALVGDRVSPAWRDQSEPLPCVTLTMVSRTPQNSITGAATLDAARVQIDSWATTFAGARAVAEACRSALEAAELKMESEFDEYDDVVDEWRTSQDFLVWIP